MKERKIQKIFRIAKHELHITNSHIRQRQDNIILYSANSWSTDCLHLRHRRHTLATRLRLSARRTSLQFTNNLVVIPIHHSVPPTQTFMSAKESAAAGLGHSLSAYSKTSHTYADILTVMRLRARNPYSQCLVKQPLWQAHTSLFVALSICKYARIE